VAGKISSRASHHHTPPARTTAPLPPTHLTALHTLPVHEQGGGGKISSGSVIKKRPPCTHTSPSRAHLATLAYAAHCLRVRCRTRRLSALKTHLRRRGAARASTAARDISSRAANGRRTLPGYLHRLSPLSAILPSRCARRQNMPRRAACLRATSRCGACNHSLRLLEKNI